MSTGSDTTYTISIAGKVITLTPSTGTAQTITIPDDLDMGFDSSGADEDKELRFIVQELTPSGKRDFSVTLASTGSSSERRYSFMKGAGTGSIALSTDPDGIVRSVAYIGSGATAFPRAERRKFRFQFGEPARKNRSLAGAKLVVNGTEHDLEDWGISSDRRYREVRTSDAVSYRYRSGSAVTFNLKFADGTYLGYTSETKATRTLLKEDIKGALGITDVRENVTSVLQDTPDAVVSTSGEETVTVSVPFDFHTVYDDAGMSPVYDAAAKRISFEGLSNSERTPVVVRSNVRLRHNGGECSVELSLREFRGAAETNRWVLARKNLEEHGTLFAFDLAGESVEAEMSGGRYYRFDIDVKRSGDENTTAGVHGTSAHVINFASFERVEGDRAWSPTERLAWPPNQASSVRLTYGDRGSGLKTTGYFFGDDEAEAEVPFSREWKGVIDAGNARVEFDVSYSGKSGSLRSPYDFKVAGSWILSDGTVSDWEKKVEVSTTASSGSQSLMFTPPSTATGMYLRYMRETNTFMGSSDEITFAAGDPVIRYVSGGGLTQAQVDARVAAGVQDWAEAGNNTAIPNAKLPTILTQAQVDARVATGVQNWAEAGNNTTIPNAKLPTILTQAQVDARVATGVQNWAEAGNAATVPTNKLPTILTEAQVKAFINDIAEEGNKTRWGENKLPKKLDDFLDASSDGGWKAEGAVAAEDAFVAAAAFVMPAAKPSLATATAAAYEQNKSIPRYTNAWDIVRVPASRANDVAEMRYVIGESTDDGNFYTEIPSASWELLGTSRSYRYYAVQIAEKPAASTQRIESYQPFEIDGGRVKITGVGSHPFLKINSGSGTGLTITSSSQDKRLANPIDFDTAFDLDDADKQSGILQVEATVQLVNRSNNAIGFNSGATSSNAVIRSQIEGFKFVSALRAATAYSATENGLLVGSLDVYKGSVTLGELELYLTRGSDNTTGYWFIWEGATGSDTFSISVNEIDVAFIHNDPGDVSGGVPAKTLLDDLPAVGTYTEGQSVYVKRGTGANQRIWEYTILGAGSARKWVKTAGDAVLLGEVTLSNAGSAAKDTGMTIPSWGTFLTTGILILNPSNAGSFFNLDFRISDLKNLGTSAIGDNITNNNKALTHKYLYEPVNALLDSTVYFGRTTTNRLLYQTSSTDPLNPNPLFVYIS